MPYGVAVYRVDLPAEFPPLPSEPEPDQQRVGHCLLMQDLGAPAYDGSASQDDGTIGGGEGLAPASDGTSKRRRQSGLSDASLALSRDGMDTVRVRVLNAFPSSPSVALRAVSADCY